MRKLLLSSVFLAAMAVSAAQAQPPAGPRTFSPGQRIANEQIARLWRDDSVAMEPFRIIGNIYYVGAADIASYLITTPQGHFLIDTGTTTMTAELPRNIEKLGFKLSDVKVLLNSHAHVDHIQAHAVMQRITGAAVMAMAADVKSMEDGHDYSSIEFQGWEPIKVDRVLHDNDEIVIGNQTVRAIWTPGHTPGNTTFVTTVQEGGRSYQVVIGGAANPVVGNPKFNTKPADAETSFRRLKELKPDIQLVGHPRGAFAGKLDALRAGARPSPLAVAPGAWEKLVGDAEAGYRRRVAEAAAPPAAAPAR